jgi:hypothetical protein
MLKKYLASFVDDTAINWENFLPAFPLSYNTSCHSTISMTPFELLFGEMEWLTSFPNEDIQKIHCGETSATERLSLLQKLCTQAHLSVQQIGEKTKMHYNKKTSSHFFQTGDKVLIANDFDTTKNPKLVPNWKSPAKIIDINDTNAKLQIGKKLKC